jgi:hypothetical protein
LRPTPSYLYRILAVPPLSCSRPKEDALQRRLFRLHEEIDLPLQLNDCLIMLGETTIHLVFKLIQPGIYCVTFEKISL